MGKERFLVPTFMTPDDIAGEATSREDAREIFQNPRVDRDVPILVTTCDLTRPFASAPKGPRSGLTSSRFPDNTGPGYLLSLEHGLRPLKVRLKDKGRTREVRPKFS